jgi:hypothetical protein
MSEEDNKPKKPPRGFQKGNTFMPPETMGAMKKNPWHMSIDELIEYKSTGVKPKYIIDPEKIYTLAKSGVSIKNICGIFGFNETTFMSNSAFTSAHAQGRSEVATLNRAMILEQAMNGSLDAMKYLDKYMGGEAADTLNINHNIIPKEIQEAPTYDLKSMLKDDNNE